MSHQAWSNAGTRLWLAGQQHELLNWCQMDDITWKSTMRQVCPYCGSFTNGKCPNCGGVGEERVRYQAAETDVLVSGVLPHASVLFFLPDGSTLELVHKACGNPSLYWDEDVVLRFLKCRVVERRMQNVMVMEASKEDYLRIQVRIECTAQLLLAADDPWKETIDQWQTQ